MIPPAHIVLAIPLVFGINTSLVAQNDILVRDRITIEQARELVMIIFDKTGALTEDKCGVIFIKRIHTGKNVESLIDILHQLRQRDRGIQYHII